MKKIILLLTVLIQVQSVFAADTKKQNEIAAYLQNFLAVEAPSLTWVQEGDFFLVQGKAQGQPLRATVHGPSARVLNIDVNGRQFYKWKGITVVGHRATMLLAPENTVAAIRKAQSLGVDLMELDVRQTKDGHLVISHDGSINRTTTGRGIIKDMTLEEIKKYDAGSKYSSEFTGEKIPTLAEALRALKDGGTLPDIDFKDGDLNLLRKTLNEAGFPYDTKFTFCGSTSEYKEVSVWGMMLIRPTSLLASMTLGSMVKDLKPEIVNVSIAQRNQGYLQSIHKRGLKSFVNVILDRTNEEQRLREVVATLPDYIQTDRPDYLVPYLRSLGLHQ